MRWNVFAVHLLNINLVKRGAHAQFSEKRSKKRARFFKPVQKKQSRTRYENALDYKVEFFRTRNAQTLFLSLLNDLVSVRDPSSPWDIRLHNVNGW